MTPSSTASHAANTLATVKDLSPSPHHGSLNPSAMVTGNADLGSQCQYTNKTMMLNEKENILHRRHVAAHKKKTRSTKSKPIQIAPNDHETEDNQHMDLSSSAELRNFYDEATWRMYLQIQAARQNSIGPAPNSNNDSSNRSSAVNARTTSGSSAMRAFEQQQQQLLTPPRHVANTNLDNDDDAIFDMEL